MKLFFFLIATIYANFAFSEKPYQKLAMNCIKHDCKFIIQRDYVIPNAVSLGLPINIYIPENRGHCILATKEKQMLARGEEYKITEVVKENEFEVIWKLESDEKKTFDLYCSPLRSHTLVQINKDTGVYIPHYFYPLTIKVMNRLLYKIINVETSDK